MTKTNGTKKGFTLAEVLITLGIIGVVAAMTIPTLIQNTNSVKFQAQFKKSVSTLSQAALMAQAQYDMDYSQATASTSTSCASDSLANQNTSICAMLNSTLAGQSYLGTYGTVKDAAGTGNYSFTTKTASPSGYLVFSLADGSLVGFDPAAANCTIGDAGILTAAMIKGATTGSNPSPAGALNKCLGFIDVNGVTLPNKEVLCQTANDTKLDPSTPCTVASTGSAMGDVFPILFHDGTVEPASNAAKAVLIRGKK